MRRNSHGMRRNSHGMRRNSYGMRAKILQNQKVENSVCTSGIFECVETSDFSEKPIPESRNCQKKLTENVKFMGSSPTVGAILMCDWKLDQIK